MAAEPVVAPAACTCSADCGCAPAVRDDSWLRLARYARWLAWVSLVWMLAEAGQRLGSGATAGEGTQNLICAAQAAAVLAGLAAVAVWPAWSAADQVIALGIAAWSAWEGRQSWRGSGCC